MGGRHPHTKLNAPPSSIRALFCVHDAWRYIHADRGHAAGLDMDDDDIRFEEGNVFAIWTASTFFISLLYKRSKNHVPLKIGTVPYRRGPHTTPSPVTAVISYETRTQGMPLALTTFTSDNLWVV